MSKKKFAIVVEDLHGEESPVVVTVQTNYDRIYKRFVRELVQHRINNIDNDDLKNYHFDHNDEDVKRKVIEKNRGKFKRTFKKQILQELEKYNTGDDDHVRSMYLDDNNAFYLMEVGPFHNVSLVPIVQLCDSNDTKKKEQRQQEIPKCYE